MKDALRIGLCAAKANAVPMVALWTVSVALVAGYYLFPDVQSALDCLGRFQRDYGIWAGFSSQFVFCGKDLADVGAGLYFRHVVHDVVPASDQIRLFNSSAWMPDVDRMVLR